MLTRTGCGSRRPCGLLDINYDSPVIGLGDVTPVRRSRWLGIAYFIHGDDLQFPAISFWSVERTLTLLEFDCIRSWPDDILDKLLVPDPALQHARTFPLERSAKHQRRCTADEASEPHIFQATSNCLPTFMAQYGSQHHLDPELLGSKGHFGFSLQSLTHSGFGIRLRLL